MNRLRELRLAKGRLQGDLAKAVGISAKAIRRHEAGRNTPSVTLAMRIAAELGVSVYDIWGETESPTSPAKATRGLEGE